MRQSERDQAKDYADTFIERARDENEDASISCGRWMGCLVADHIEQLRAENERMRELLNWVVPVLRLKEDEWNQCGNPMDAAATYKRKADEIESLLAENP